MLIWEDEPKADRLVRCTAKEMDLSNKRVQEVVSDFFLEIEGKGIPFPVIEASISLALKGIRQEKAFGFLNSAYEEIASDLEAQKTDG